MLSATIISYQNTKKSFNKQSTILMFLSLLLFPQMALNAILSKFDGSRLIRDCKVSIVTKPAIHPVYIIINAGFRGCENSEMQLIEIDRNIHTFC
jgi:hypothetical protein